MSSAVFPVQLAPTSLYQPILPGWQVSLFSVNLGNSSNPQIEQAAINKVGSYGKQIGHLAEALEIVIEELGLLEKKSLGPEKLDALRVFLRDVSNVRKLK